jgi:predicted dehydrogenase
LTTIGLIGAGGIAQTHLRTLAAIPDVKVAAVADIDLEAAQRTAARWEIPDVHQDYRELVSRGDIEGVLVCTPTAVHAPPAIAALEAGKHVLVEKPMEATLAAAAEMVRAAHRSGRILMCALKLRFSPQLAAARRIVDSGALGHVYYGETIADRRRAMSGGSFVRRDLAGLGVTADLGIYALDTALYVLGHPKPVAVSAVMSNAIGRTAETVYGAWSRYPLPDLDVEDFAAAWIRFEDGMRLVLKTSWSLNMDTLGGTFFLGERAGLRIGVLEVKGTETGVFLFRDEFGAMTKVQLDNVDFRDNQELFAREDRAWIEAIRTGSPSPIDPDGVLLTNVIIQGIVDSASAGGREVEVSVPLVA